MHTEPTSIDCPHTRMLPKNPKSVCRDTGDDDCGKKPKKPVLFYVPLDTFDQRGELHTDRNAHNYNQSSGPPGKSQLQIGLLAMAQNVEDARCDDQGKRPVVTPVQADGLSHRELPRRALTSGRTDRHHMHHFPGAVHVPYSNVIRVWNRPVKRNADGRAGAEPVPKFYGFAFSEAHSPDSRHRSLLEGRSMGMLFPLGQHGGNFFGPQGVRPLAAWHGHPGHDGCGPAACSFTGGDARGTSASLRLAPRPTSTMGMVFSRMIQWSVMDQH